MSFFHWLGGVLAPGHQQAADDANSALNQTLTPGGAYYNAGNYIPNNDSSELSAAAGLNASPIATPNYSAMDQDAGAMGSLGATLGDIAQNGGPLEAAIANQGASDVANQGTANLKAQARQTANQVTAAMAQERGNAASEKNALTAQELGNLLKKQTYAMAISHANAQAALAGHAIQNSLANNQYAVNASLQEGAQAARAGQNAASQGYNASQFSNGLSVAQAAISAASQAGSTGVGAFSGANTSDASAGSVSGSGTSAGYSVGAPRINAVVPNTQAPVAAYNDPISGATSSNLVPSSTASWGDWLSANSSSLVA